MQNRSLIRKTSVNPPQKILDLIAQAKSTKLYLIKEIKPTCLIYSDDFGNKFKVELSTKMICSCNQNQTHCIHTIRALIKEFQVSEKCPILWKQQYSTFDIYNILNRHYKTVKKQNKKGLQKVLVNQQQLLEKNNNIQLYIKQQTRMDDMCPICQDLLSNNEPLVYCSKQCENIFHSKCLKFWVQQQQIDCKNINCPICRLNWSDTTLNEIVSKEKEFLNLSKIHNIRCNYCQTTPIYGILFTCISCPNYHLCKTCHHKNIHKQKHFFMFKYYKFERYEFELNLTFESLMKLFPQNLNANNPENGGLILMNNCQQQQFKCSFCQSQKQLRLLQCGHIADETCIDRMKENYFICPIDYQPQFIGLFNTLTQEQKKLHLIETQKWLHQFEDEQYNKQFQTRQPFQTRYKQLSLHNSYDTNNKLRTNQQKKYLFPLKRQFSAYQDEQDYTVYIQSAKSKIEYIL